MTLSINNKLTFAVMTNNTYQIVSLVIIIILNINNLKIVKIQINKMLKL